MLPVKLRNTLPLLGFLSLFMCANLSTADTLNMPKAETKHTGPLPRLGADKDAVRNQFGAPDSQHGPVGDPPISYWEYPSFTVYFEYGSVLHTVNKTESALSR